MMIHLNPFNNNGDSRFSSLTDCCLSLVFCLVLVYCCFKWMTITAQSLSSINFSSTINFYSWEFMYIHSQQNLYFPESRAPLSLKQFNAVAKYQMNHFKGSTYQQCELAIVGNFHFPMMHCWRKQTKWELFSFCSSWVMKWQIWYGFSHCLDVGMLGVCALLAAKVKYWSVQKMMILTKFTEVFGKLTKNNKLLINNTIRWLSVYKW